MFNETNSSNIQLIYDYAQQALKELDDSSSVLNTKLGIVLGFDITLIRLLYGIPDNSLMIQLSNLDLSLTCYLCLLLKVFAYISLMISLGFGLWGFRPVSSGLIVEPEELIDKCLNISEEQFRISIINVWNQSIKEIAILRDRTARILSLAVFFLGLAGILSAFDIILSLIIN